MHSKRISLFITLLTIAWLFACSHTTVTADDKEPASLAPPRKSSRGSILVMPNESVVKGIVSGYCAVSSRLLDIKPEQVIYKITIKIESSENIKNLPDFINGKEGQDITFHTKEKQPVEILGKKIKARARFKGHDRGGTYWMNNIEFIAEGE
jgi:hypothetical protein